jgi:hypothetical protein
MPRYLLEHYAPFDPYSDLRGVLTAVERAATSLARDYVDVAHVRTLYVPEDETCFHVLDAPTSSAVLCLALTAGLLNARVTEVVEATGGPQEPQPGGGSRRPPSIAQ